MKHLFTMLFIFTLLTSPFTLQSHAAAPAPVPQTGQTTSYRTGDDGALKPGVAWPDPRFTDNANGTITDNLTGLIWLKNANCTETVGGKTPTGGLPWADSITWSNALTSGKCGLTDGTVAGNWRLPNAKELKSLINRQQANISTWLNGITVGFSNVQAGYYWSSSTGISAGDTSSAWNVDMYYGGLSSSSKLGSYLVWPVRGGQ
jgi:hypothetical protein